MGRFEEAREVLARALELTGHDPWVRASHGAALLGLDRYPEALEELESVVAAHDDNVFALIKCGELRNDIADYAGAWTVLRRAAAIDDDTSQAWLEVLLGWTALQRSDGEVACRHFSRATELLPMIPHHALEGEALMTIGKHEEAAAKYQEAIGLAQQHEGELSVWELAAVGWCFMGLGSYDEAARLLRLAAVPENEPSVCCDLALALFCSGRAELAIKEYERAFAEAAKRHPWRRYAVLAIAKAELGQYLVRDDLPFSQSDVRRVKRRVSHELRSAEVNRYVPPSDRPEDSPVA